MTNNLPQSKMIRQESHSGKLVNDVAVDEMVMTTFAGDYSTSLTLEVRCVQSKHAIVHIMNDEGRIVKMFGWYLLKGDNITTVPDMDAYNYPYTVTIYDHDGNTLFSSRSAS